MTEPIVAFNRILHLLGGFLVSTRYHRYLNVAVLYQWQYSVDTPQLENSVNDFSLSDYLSIEVDVLSNIDAIWDIKTMAKEGRIKPFCKTAAPLNPVINTVAHQMLRKMTYLPQDRMYCSTSGLQLPGRKLPKESLFMEVVLEDFAAAWSSSSSSSP